MGNNRVRWSAFRAALDTAVPLWVFPIVIFGGIILSERAPASLRDFYIETALPFLITVWIGAGFTFAWGVVRESMLREKAPRGMMAAVGILSALTLLSMLGGVSLMWEDPWLFGVAVWPGLNMARGLIERRGNGHSTPTPLDPPS